MELVPRFTISMTFQSDLVIELYKCLRLCTLQIDSSESTQPDREAMLFPEPHMQGAKIVDIALTSDFFIFITDVSIFPKHISKKIWNSFIGSCKTVKPANVISTTTGCTPW